MKIIRYRDAAGHVGHASQEADGTAREIAGDIFGAFSVTEKAADVRATLAPVAPPLLVGIGLNYRRHAEEIGASVPLYPIVFYKSAQSVQHPSAPIVLPRGVEKADYECELAVVIGRACKDVPRERALEHVLGYTCGNDVSARDWQIERSGGQWCYGKSFDTFAPLGPCLVTADEVPRPNALGLRTRLNGETVQDWNTSDMIFDVPALIEFLSAGTTLPPGTVILTGTPQGVGMARTPPRWLRPGDTVTVEIDGIGALSNPVEAQE